MQRALKRLILGTCNSKTLQLHRLGPTPAPSALTLVQEGMHSSILDREAFRRFEKMLSHFRCRRHVEIRIAHLKPKP